MKNNYHVQSTQPKSLITKGGRMNKTYFLFLALISCNLFAQNIPTHAEGLNEELISVQLRDGVRQEGVLSLKKGFNHPSKLAVILPGYPSVVRPVVENKAMVSSKLNGNFLIRARRFLVKNEQEIVKHSFIHEKAHKNEPHDDHKHGHDHSDIKLTKEEEDDILDISKRRVKLALVLNQIGEDFKIQVTTQELQQELQKQMSMYPGQEKQIRDYYQKNPSEITRLRGPIYEDKIVELVKSKAKVTLKEVNKKELEELVKDLSSNLKSKSATKSATSSDDKSKKYTKSEDKSKSSKKISKK